MTPHFTWYFKYIISSNCELIKHNMLLKSSSLHKKCSEPDKLIFSRSHTCFMEEIRKRIIYIMPYIAPPVRFARSDHEVEVAL